MTNPGDTPFVLLAAYAQGFMSQRLIGSVTVGLPLGLSKFVTTVAITLAYARFTRKTWIRRSRNSAARREKKIMNGDVALNISIFLVIVAVTLYVVYRVSSRNTTTADYCRHRAVRRAGGPLGDGIGAGAS